MDLVSVIIPYYSSNSDLLFRAIESVYKQSYKRIQVVVCVDGSNIDRGLFRKLTESSTVDFKVVYHVTNKGISLARNSAVRASDGKWLTWLDADDTLDEFCVENLVKLSKDMVMVLGNCLVYEDNDLYLRDIGKYIEEAKLFWKTENDPFLHNITAIQPELVSKEAFIKVGGFRPEYKYAEMTDFFLRVLSTYGIESFAHSSKAIYNYHRDMSSHSQKDREALFNYRIKALMDYAIRMKYSVNNIKYEARNSDGMQHFVVY